MTLQTLPAALEPDQPVAFGALQRVRYETRRRTLDVAAVEALTPKMRRIRFQSPELGDFESLSPDDHIKIFTPDADGASVMRDYTPRSFDTANGTLVIDFALHDAGPATAWALSARPGDKLEIGGPRGSSIIPDVFDWYLLIGDETALPAIGRRVEALRPEAEVTTLVVVDDAAEIQSFAAKARWEAEWMTRDVSGLDDIENARQVLDRWLPRAGEGFIWIAGEAQFARSLRTHLVERHNWPLTRMKAAGYWLRGGVGVHEQL
jgi:NADPH-dependent ferric siderophore reductase